MRRKTDFATGSIYHIYNRGIRKSEIFTTQADYLRWQELLHWTANYNYPYSLFEDRKMKLKTSSRETSSLIRQIDEMYKLETSSVKILSYVSMPNHYHLLLEQSADHGIQKYMQRLQAAYSKYFNLKYELVGSVFQGRFKDVPVVNEPQFQQVQKYILRNPMVAKLVSKKKFINYPWSAIREYLNPNLRKIITLERILSFFTDPNKLSKFLLDDFSDEEQLSLDSISIDSKF